MNKENKNLFICHTYYHVLIAVILQLNNKDKSDIIIAADTEENSLLKNKKLLNNLKKSNLFDKVIIFDHSKEISRGLLFDIKYACLINKLCKNNKYEFDKYKDIYIFNEQTIIGTILNRQKVFYTILEDGADCYKNKHRKAFKRKKGILRKKVKEIVGMYDIASSPFIKNIVVNDKTDLWIENENIIEKSKKDLFNSLTKKDKNIILKIFLTDSEYILNLEDSNLLITQPLNEHNFCETEAEKLEIYKKIIEDYADNNVIIKTHPREKTNYIDYFKDNDKVKIITDIFPIELVNFFPIKLKKVITISSTSIDQIENCEETITLNNDFIENNITKTVDKKEVVKSGFWYMFSNVLVKVISFFTIPIFTRLLSQEEFGYFNNYNSWLQIVAIFVTLNLHNSLVNAKHDYKKNYDEYIFSTFALNTILVTIWFIIFNCFNSFFTAQFNLSIKYINFMCIYILFNTAFMYVQIRSKMLFKYKANVIMNIIDSISTTLLSVILVLLMNDKLEGRLLGITMVSVLVGSYSIILMLKRGKKIKLSYWKYSLKLCLPYIPHALAGMMISSIDKILITNTFGNEQTAIYSIAIHCCMIIPVIQTSFSSAFFPWLGDKLKEEEYNDINKTSKKYLLLYLILVFGVMLITPEMLLFMGGKDYLAAKSLIVPIALSEVYHFIASLFSDVEYFKKKTFILSLATISATIINLTLNYFFISKFGYSTAAYVKVISYVWLLIVHMIIIYKMGYSKLYDYKYIIGISLLVLLGALIINYSYTNIIFRIILIIIYAILFVSGLLNQKFINIKEIIKK